MPATEGLDVIRDVTEVAQVCQGAEKVFVIGGARLFADLLPLCSQLYLTWIDEPYEGDVLLPPFEHLFEQIDTLGSGEGYEFRLYRRKV
jgi:dihydrofolate reductase